MTENFQDNVCIHHLWELERAISVHANCKWAGPGHKDHKRNEGMNETRRRVMNRAEWLFYYDFGLTKRRMVLDIPPRGRRRKYKLVAYVGDIQRNPRKYLKHLNTCGWDALLMAYIKTGYEIFSRPWKRGKEPQKHDIKKISTKHYTRGLDIPWFYAAPSIDPQQFKPLDLPRKYDVTMIGATHPDAYPLRQVLWEGLPSYTEEMKWNALLQSGLIGPSLNRSISNLKENHYVGDRYARALAQSKIFIFGTSVFKYVLFKFPEAMACKTLVMADVPLTAEEYHLVPDENFVWINKDNWRDKLKYYLENDDEREAIAQRGYETVMKYHTTGTRGKQVVNFLRKQK